MAPQGSPLNASSRVAPSWMAAAVAAVLGTAACDGARSPAVAASPPAGTAAMREDAELADVFFLDGLRGWAVGDRGVVWHTEDGGRNWQEQATPVGCRLESVWFNDAANGWAVGGEIRPYTHQSNGVVLRTTDGGRRWTAVPSPLLPALRKVRFFDGPRGFAVGQPSATFPSGIFRSDDGGRSWHSLPLGELAGSRQVAAWLTGDFRAPGSGAVAGNEGALAAVAGGKLVASPTPSPGSRSLRRMLLSGATDGWLVGDGGLVLATPDGGLSWQAPAGALPRGIHDHFDFSALAARGPRVWIAGTPGSCVLASGDAGRTWSLARTGQSLPLRALAFADEQHGWGVGAMGTILATRDGGQSWQRQRGGGSRAAVAGFFARPAAVPLELFARLSGDEGYLGVAEILARPAGDDASEPAAGRILPERRTHEALLAVGACGANSAWRFPLRDSQLRLTEEAIVEEWNRATDGRGVARLEAHLVSRIRLWRPEVVVTEHAAPREDPLAHLVGRIVLAAAEKAADPSSYPDQITVAGLNPWTVKKVYATLPGDVPGEANVTAAQLAPRLGRSLAEQAALAQGYLADRHEPRPALAAFGLLVDRLPQGTGRRDFFSGISLAPGSDARRALELAPSASLDAIRRAAQLRRNIEQLLARSDDELRASPAWLGQLGDMTRGIGEEGAGDILYQLAMRYQRAGRGEFAAECWQLLAERHPNHRLAEPALLHLMQYHASGEVAWRLNRDAQWREETFTAPAAPAAPAEELNVHRPAEGGAFPSAFPGSFPGAVVPAGFHQQGPGKGGPAGGTADSSPIGPQPVRRGRAATGAGQTPRERLAKAVMLGQSIQGSRPTLWDEPSLRFPLAAAWREGGLERDAHAYYRAVVAGRPRDGWWECAQGEAWLAEPTGVPAKSVWPCVRAAGKPRLDGRLDDPLWRAAKPIRLASPRGDDADWQAALLAAYDDEYLYLAASCRQAPGASYPSSRPPRPRDADLAEHDRIEIAIDLDRDYASYYLLVIDHRGFTRDACHGDATWDPEWFVAAADDGGIWTVEAAVPLAELTGTPPAARSAWAVGAQRIVPGAGFQSWTRPAAPTTVPQGFGYLVFQ
jgi:photosystem II stability/assembly factor-like uncharacterized protein